MSQVENPEYLKNRSVVLDMMMDEYGYIFCQAPDCGVSRAFKYHCHHIMSRSRYPDHPLLHSAINLIILCDVCHSLCHGNAHLNPGFRQELIDNRNLVNIFKNHTHEIIK